MDKTQLNIFVNQLKISPVEILREETEMLILNHLAQSEIGKKLIFKAELL